MLQESMKIGGIPTINYPLDEEINLMFNIFPLISEVNTSMRHFSVHSVIATPVSCIPDCIPSNFPHEG